ncbi:MAG: hypothetical protein WCJ33_08585 [Pseudomonadota bacterium]
MQVSSDLTITNNNPILDIRTDEFMRKLFIEGKPAYEIGLCCDTCSFYFERLGGAYPLEIKPEEIGKHLFEGLTIANRTDVINAVSKLFPTGKYKVQLRNIQPKLIEPFSKADYFTHDQLDLFDMDGFFGVPHYPKVKYYRGVDRMINNKHKLFEFFIPFAPQNWLTPERVAEYESQFQQSKKPTVISITIVDVRQPANWSGNPTITKHTCVAHYIIDGHHKLFASSKAQKEITLLSFVATEKCMADESEINETLK